MCFFAHKPEELRVPPCRPSLPVPDDGWAFGVEAPEDLESTVMKLMESGTGAIHRRTLSVPPGFLDGLNDQANDHFQVSTRVQSSSIE